MKCIGFEIVVLNMLGGVSGYFYVLFSFVFWGFLVSLLLLIIFIVWLMIVFFFGWFGSCGFFVFFWGWVIWWVLFFFFKLKDVLIREFFN